MRRIGVKRSIREQPEDCPVATPAPKRLKVSRSREAASSSSPPPPPLLRRVMAGCSRLWKGFRDFFVPRQRDGETPGPSATPHFGDENVPTNTPAAFEQLRAADGPVKTTPTNDVIVVSKGTPPSSDGLLELFPSNHRYTSPLPPVTPAHHHSSQTGKKLTPADQKNQRILQERTNERRIYSSLLPSHPHHPHQPHTATHLPTHSQRSAVIKPSSDFASRDISNKSIFKHHTSTSYTPHTLPPSLKHTPSSSSSSLFAKPVATATAQRLPPRSSSKSLSKSNPSILFSSTPFPSTGRSEGGSARLRSSIEDISPLKATTHSSSVDRENASRQSLSGLDEAARRSQSVCSREVQTIPSPLPIHTRRAADTEKSRNWLDHLRREHAHSKVEQEMMEKMIRGNMLRERLRREQLDDDRVARLKEQLRWVGLERSSSSSSSSLPGLEICLQLSDEQEDKVAMATEEVGSGRECLSERFNISITRSDIATLTHLNWLNDEIINFYFQLIVERSQSGRGKVKVHAMTSFFYPKLSQAGYSGVRRWTKKVDIFAQDLVLVPIHLGMHWALATLDMKRNRVCYYDSLHGNAITCLQRLTSYLVSEALDKKGESLDPSSWTTFSPSDIPRQMNGSDCGVFACMYARHLASEAVFSFSQSDMPQVRDLMICEILEQKLL